MRELLELMTGPDRKRAVIWVGPAAFPGEGSRRLGPVITSILDCIGGAP